LVADHPGVVAGRQGRHLAGSGVQFGALGGEDPQGPGHVVLEVRCLAQVRAGERLDVLRPAPARLEHEAADLRASDRDDLGAAEGELAHLVGCGEVAVLDALKGAPRGVDRVVAVGAADGCSRSAHLVLAGHLVLGGHGVLLDGRARSAVGPRR
jgi:hypothetical protein